jgi:hypothetical protein
VSYGCVHREQRDAVPHRDEEKSSESDAGGEAVVG